MRRLLRSPLFLVPLGIVVAQCILYAPSLLGQKLLLPLDCLKHGDAYIWPESDEPGPPQYNWLLSDAIVQVEVDRIYAAREIRQGRLPFWNPYNYCGVPFLANNNSAVFSPFMIPSYLWPGPEILAWTQLLRALVAGIGTYLFFRRTLQFGFIPALFGAWAFPLTGFLIMWNWIHFSSVVSLLPWMLMATDLAVRGPSARGVPLLALATAVTLLSGKMDTSAHVLLASGMYALYALFDEHKQTIVNEYFPIRRMLLPVWGWALGFGLAAPIVLPTHDYLQSSYRIEVRAQGLVDFPPNGVDAMTPLVLPFIHGADLTNFVGYGNVLESASIGYAGFLTALFLVPVGWSSPRRSQNTFWAIAGICALSTQLQIPVISDIYSLPVLNLLKNNRFIFWTSWCLIATAVAGIEVLLNQRPRWRWWHTLASVGVAALGGWCAFRSFTLPQAVMELGESTVEAAFRVRYVEAIVLSVLTLALYFLLFRSKPIPRFGIACIILLVTAEMIYQAFGFIPQADKKMYYPRNRLLAEVNSLGPGRVCGVHIMVPSLNRIHWLHSIRGYDGADPKAIFNLFAIANPGWDEVANYAVTQTFVPEFSPILRMLNLRYRIGRGDPPESIEIARREKRLWLHIDEDALPRPYVPKHVMPVSTQNDALSMLGNPQFDPAEVAYAEGSQTHFHTDIRGTAKIVEEAPGHIVIDCNMGSAGFIVLNDIWYPGWSARYEGKSIAVSRTNGALIGMEVPAGRGTIELTYVPRFFRLGVWIMLFSGLICLAWFATKRRDSSTAAPNTALFEN